MSPTGTWKRITTVIADEATFIRVHVVCFTFIPLIFSGIFYACNGRFHISYLDSLFLCYSAMTVTGLSTVNLSTTTTWQQVILYLLMGMGDITVVSWIMVLVRKYYFRRTCEYIESTRRSRLSRLLTRSRTAMVNAISAPVSAFPLHAQDDASRPVSARGGIGSTQSSSQDEKTASSTAVPPTFDVTGPTPAGTLFDHGDDITQNAAEHLTPSPPAPNGEQQFFSDINTFSSSPREENASLPPSSPVISRAPQGVEFATSVSMTPSMARRRLGTIREGVPYKRTTTLVSSRSRRSATGIPGDLTDVKYQGPGGFPGPATIAKSAVQRMLPKTYRKLERKLTLPSSTTLNAQPPNSHEPTLVEGPTAAWLKFDGLHVGRNSDFRIDTLSDEQVEAIGGVEYRALRLLSYLVAFYFIGTQLFSFILLAPWLSSTHEYDSVFQAQTRLVQKPWFSLFQVMGGYTGGGLSLVDLGMVPFQRAYLMIFALMFVILAGNHAMPIFLRLIIWISSKLVGKDARSYETLSFLLDHPRRCFVYLFPMHQTWFLVICLVLFSALEWASFLVLDIGLGTTDSLPVGTRVLAGLFQGLAARASGFSIVPVASLAPAVQFLYVVMMYIAVYPVAMSIRTTNVFEEPSLGVYEAPPDDEDEEPQLSGTRRERLHKYLGWHLHRQLSIDIWWLVWAVFVICIIERHNLLDEDKKWFDIFRVLFETVSAFGGIGLSLGLPSDNFSFVGALKPLSKLVIIVIMVRGRHRGLPVAVDRSIMLPRELVISPPSQADSANNPGASSMPTPKEDFS